MRFPRHPRLVGRRVPWLLGVLMTLGGLVAMHGLAGHGMSTSDMAGMPAPAAVVHQVTYGVPTATHQGSPTVTAASGQVTSPGQVMDMGASGMCVAVLLLMLVGLFAGRREGLLKSLEPPSRSDLVDPGGRQREPDPPSLSQLSICRC